MIGNFEEFAIRSPEAAIPDKTKQISIDGFHHQFTSNKALELKFQRAREILVHSFRGRPTDCELLENVFEVFLEQRDPERKELRKAKKLTLSKVNETPDESYQDEESSNNSQAHPSLKGNDCEAKSEISSLVKGRVKIQGTSYVPAGIARAVRFRDGFCCTHVSSQTGEVCQSRFATELDHIIPRSLEGKTTLKNLRVVSRTHNQRYVIEKLGRKTMSAYLNV